MVPVHWAQEIYKIPFTRSPLGCPIWDKVNWRIGRKMLKGLKTDNLDLTTVSRKHLQYWLPQNQGKITAKSIIQYFSNWISEKPSSSSVSSIGMLQGETQTTYCISVSVLSSFVFSFLWTSITTKDSIWTKVLCQNKQKENNESNLNLFFYD